MRVVTLMLLLALLAWAQAPSPITIVHTYAGFSGPNPPDAGSTSADMMGGLNAKFLVGFTNRGFGVWSKTDGHLIQPVQTQMEFWTAAFKKADTAVPGKPYDPRIAFDPLTSRWFASANTNINGLSDHVFFAVSADDDPTHPWKAVEYKTPMTVDNLKLGFDKFGVYSAALSGRPDPSPISVPVMAIPKKDLLWKGHGTPGLSHLSLFEVPAGGRMSDRKYSGVEGMVPAFDLNPHKKAGDPEIYVNRYRQQIDGETILQIRKLTWSSPEKATLSEPVSIGLGVHYSVQPSTLGRQPDLPGGLVSPGIRAGEARIVNAVVKNGHLWTIAAAEVNQRDGAFWVQIDLHTMKLVQHGTLTDPNGDILFPSLNVDDRDNLGMGMSRTSHDEALSIYVTGRLASDPPNTLRPLVRAVQGHFVHYRNDIDLTKPGQSVSWSDYSTVVTDPSDPSLFWTFQEATTNETMPKENADSYGTHWVAWRIAAPLQPKNATSGIVEACHKNPAVALAETTQAVDEFHAFYRSLLTDPAFLAMANDKGCLDFR